MSCIVCTARATMLHELKLPSAWADGVWFCETLSVLIVIQLQLFACLLLNKSISDDGVQPLLLFHCAASSQQFVSMWVSWGEWETGNIRNNLSFCWCSSLDSLGCGASAWFTMIYITYICMTTPWHLRATLGESRGLAPAPCCSKALPNLR